jgi:hypothetical protein
MNEEYSKHDVYPMTKQYSYDEAKNLLLNGAVLPQDFDQWTLADEYGWTIAHEVAYRGCLPENFSQWDMADNNGWPVAHEAVNSAHLPENFGLWALADARGIPLLSQLLSKQDYISDKFIVRWHTEKPLCKTEADWEVFKVVLPEIYRKYTIVELFVDTDNAESQLL